MSSIAVFDSGVGGLTILSALKNKWPGENFVYLADTARLPYGTKSLNTIHAYVSQNLAYLNDNFDIKAIVVACNSASTALLQDPPKLKVPVFNVIEPGARIALRKSSQKKIGVLATRATVFSEAYPKSIRKIDPAAEVFQQPAPLLVPLVEEGWVDDPVTGIIVYRYTSMLAKHAVDTVIMGCTHFPVLRGALKKALGPNIELVDSSEGLIEDFSSLNLNSNGEGRLEILCTDFSPRLEETVRMILGPIPYSSLEPIDLKIRT